MALKSNSKHAVQWNGEGKKETMDQDISKSGSPIYRDKAKTEWEPRQGFSNIEEIEKHIEKYVGKPDSVFHEIASDLIHIDVHIIKPNDKNNNCWVFVASGMSDLPMAAPEKAKDFKYAELLCILPSAWNVTDKLLSTDNDYNWPILNIKFLARYVHKASTWFAHGHSIQNSDPPSPFNHSVSFCATLFSYPVSLHRDFMKLKINDEKTINFYATIPLFKEELDYKMSKGLNPLLAKFDKQGINEIINIDRPNVVSKQWWNIF